MDLGRDDAATRTVVGIRPEPAAAPTREQWRLVDLDHPEPLAVEAAGVVLTAARAANLDVVQTHAPERPVPSATTSSPPLR
ncbi:hypothetical protein GCM10010972_20640 [Cellulomonas carbonis]|nr:hypothetical protein GCM10010972_20640 [Cellulomonas carbonis]